MFDLSTFPLTLIILSNASKSTISSYIYIYIYVCVCVCVCVYIWLARKNRKETRFANLKNALFQHISQSNHKFDFNFAKILIYIHNKRLRRIIEAAAISLCNSLNTRPGFYNSSPYLSKSILNSYNIFN